MPYDGLFAAAICRELNDTIVGARIDKIFQPTADTVLLHCRRPGETHKLLLSANAQNARVHLTTTRPDNPLHAPAFCMLLRKHLDPGRIAAVEQQGLDRIIRLYVDAFDETGEPVRRILIAEMTGRNSNILLVDEQSGLIIDALRRASSRVNLYRALLPGELYVPPPDGDKLDPRTQSAADMQARIEAAVGNQSEAAGPLLTKLFDGIGPFAAREIALRAGITDEVTHETADRLAVALHELSAHVGLGRFSPTIKLDSTGAPADFWAFAPVGWPTDTTRPCAGANDAADAYYLHRVIGQAVAEKRRLLQRGVTTARRRLARKAAALQKDLDNAARAEDYRIRGELLTANMHLVGRGTEATVPNYYAGGELITIELDPTLGPAANAQQYFKRYSKAKTARTVVQQQLDATSADIGWLDQAAMHIDIADSEEQLAEIGRELAAAGMLPRNVSASLQREERGRRRQSARGKGRQAESPPIEAIIGDGVRVLIGGNSRQNERISLRMARPDDIWLHVKDIAGAHVLLPRSGMNGEEPVPELIAEAAALAAYFSKARKSSNVAVDWTLAKHVRKPRGARTGMVIYDHHRTVYVTPEEETVLKQLAMAKQ